MSNDAMDALLGLDEQVEQAVAKVASLAPPKDISNLVEEEDEAVAARKVMAVPTTFPVPPSIGRDPRFKAALKEVQAEIDSGKKLTRLPADVPATLVPERKVHASIPKRWQHTTLDDFEPVTEQLQRVHRAAKKFVTLAKKNTEGVMLALVGPPGVGKSHLLYGIATELLNAGVPIFCRPWYALAEQLRWGDGKLDAREVREMLWKQDIILIDEVRATAGTSFDDTELARLACHAYDHCKTMLITSNVNPIRDIMGDAAASRFATVVLTGDDWRKKT